MVDIKALPPEQIGMLTIEPSEPVRVGDTFDIVLRYELGELPLREAQQIIIEWREIRGIRPQFNDPDKHGYTRIETAADARLEVEVTSRNYSGYLGCPTRGISITVTEGSLEPGDALTITIREPRTSAPFDMTTLPFPTDYNFYLRRDLAGGIGYLDRPATLVILPGKPDRLRLIAPSGVEAGGSVEVTAQVRDAWDNTVDAYAGKVELSLEGPAGEPVPLRRPDIPVGPSIGDKNVAAPARARPAEEAETLAVSDGVAAKQTGALPEGVYFARGLVREGCWQATSNPMRATDGERVFFGDIHGKVFFSGGCKDVDEYYEYARDETRLDFSAITGVSELFRQFDTGYRDGRPPLNDENWARLQEAASRFTVDGEFAAFLAFEWQKDIGRLFGECPPGTDPEDAAFGDRNVYYLHDDEPFFRPFDAGTCTAEGLFDALRGRDCLVIPHHSSAPDNFGGIGDKGADFTDRDDELMRLVEICSHWGVSEYEENPRAITNFSHGHFVRDALAMGHRLGFIGSSDTHLSLPGARVKESVSALRYGAAGLACVYAPELTKEAIFEALRARRCYATAGSRMLIDFSVNGQFMGSEMRAGSEPPMLSCWAAGEDTIESIEIIRNGEVVHTYVPSVQSRVAFFEWAERDDLSEVALTAEGRPPFVYYYMRVTQDDWERGWSSPCWLDLG